MRRLMFIYNPRSSQYCHVEAEVLPQLRSLKGYLIGKYAIRNTTFNANVTALAKLLRPGDLVLSAGGDATAAITANAILRSGAADITLAVLPYGNFNDLARTLKTRDFSQIFKVPLRSKSLHPLEIYVDGKLWRYATCYVTIGMTAESVELFDDTAVRHSLQKGHRSSWRSYLYLAKWYFTHRHRKDFLPEFTLNGTKVKRASDYAAVNGRSMCRVMKGGNDYLSPSTFRSCTDYLVSFPRLFMLMMKSMLRRVPGTVTTADLLTFTHPATVELQAEGEYQIFRNIKTIEIKKGAKCLQVIHH